MFRCGSRIGGTRPDQAAAALLDQQMMIRRRLPPPLTAGVIRRRLTELRTSPTSPAPDPDEELKE